MLANQKRLVAILKHLRDDKTNGYVTPFYVCTAPINGQVNELMNKRVTMPEITYALEILGFQRVPGNSPNISSIFGPHATHVCDKTSLFIHVDYTYLIGTRTPLEILRYLMEMIDECEYSTK